jgi:hypothetical protein
MEHLLNKRILGYRQSDGKAVSGTVKRLDIDGVFVSLSGHEDEYVEGFLFFDEIKKVDGKPFIQPSTNMKDEVETQLIQVFAHIGMDLPDNLETIVQSVYEFILNTKTDEELQLWGHRDVIDGLKDWIESYY